MMKISFLLALIPLGFIISCNYSLEKKPQLPVSPSPNSNSSSPGSKISGVYSNTLFPKCLPCHNTTNPQGGVSLSSIEEIRRFGDVIRFRVLVKKDMPPQEKLTETEMTSLQKWLDQGAPVDLGSDEWSVSDVPNFEEIKLRIFAKSCFQCHSGESPEGNLDLENIENVKNSREQIFERAITNSTMPMAPFEELTKKQKKLLSNWLIEGAP